MRDYQASFRPPLLVLLLLAALLAVTPASGLAQGAVSCIDDDGDGLTGVSDIQAIADRWRGPYDRLYDLDGDGDQDVVDVQLAAAHWNRACLTVALAGPAETNVGAALDLSVTIAHATGLGGFEFVLLFDPALAQAQDVQLGPFLGSSGRNTFANVQEIDNEQGRLSYLAVSFGEAPTAEGDGLLATATLTPAAAGALRLQLADVVLSDGAGLALAFTLRDMIVQILPPDTFPMSF